MSIASEITRLQNAKASLKTAINAKGGSLTNETLDQYASAVDNLPSPKEEETKTITPNFASGNVVVTPTTGKVLSQVTINKDTNLIADNIKKDVTVHGITGTYEGSGGGIVDNESILLVERAGGDSARYPIIVNLFNLLGDFYETTINLYGATSSGGANETLLATFSTDGDFGYHIFLYILEKGIYTHLKYTVSGADGSYLYYHTNYWSTPTKVNANTYFPLDTNICSITINAQYWD